MTVRLAFFLSLRRSRPQAYQKGGRIPPPDPANEESLLARVGAGDRAALEELLALHRPLMRRVAEVRMDAALRGRLDPSDVVQEAQLEVARRMDDFLERRPMPFVLWLRQTTLENLLRLRRRHLSAECRSVARELPLPEGSSVFLAKLALAEDPAALQSLVARELAERVSAAVAELPDADREVLLLRCYEELTNQESAAVLGIDPNTCSQRFGRSIIRLRRLLVRDQSGTSHG
jgi:RNA polymerase sigma-70 factor (ECF subfamily)